MAELRLGERTRDIAAALAPHPEASTLELSLWQFQSWLLHRLAEASR